MSRYKAYAEYKDSGVEWIGEIPSHWSSTPLKWQIEKNDGGVWGDDPNGEMDTIVLRSTEQSVDGYWKLDDPALRKLSLNERQFALLKAGDLLVTKSSGSSLHIGKTTLVTEEIEELGCCYSNFMQRIRTRSSLLPRLAWYVMNNDLSRKQFDFLANSTTGLANLNGTMMGLILVTLPPIVEQLQIANFLDHETAKIDTLIAKQQDLIKLLKEKRQAVISHAVTKGLNPNAPMRDSGVDWLGEVPAHWDVKRIGSLFSESNARANSAEELRYPILSVSIHHGISDKELNEEELDRKVTRSDDKSLYKIVHQNDLAYNMMRAWQGGFGASTLSGLVSPAYIVCKPKTALNSFYFELVLRTSSAVTELKRYSRGITDFRLRLYWDEFKCIEVPVPLKSEADEILSAILKINTTYDNLVIVAEDQIRLLQERRTALISAAVTGKIDVRDWQPAQALDLEDAAA